MKNEVRIETYAGVLLKILYVFKRICCSSNDVAIMTILLYNFDLFYNNPKRRNYRQIIPVLCLLYCSLCFDYDVYIMK